MKSCLKPLSNTVHYSTRIEHLSFRQNYKNTLVKNLSYGEKRKLEISRLVIEKKKLWILDEPYLGLDKTIISTLNETLTKHIKNEGMAIFASHFSPEISGIETIELENYANN